MGADVRLKRLELQNRLLWLALIVLSALFTVGNKNDGETVDQLRCRRLEVIDTNGKTLAVIGEDSEGSRGLFVHDSNGRLRLANITDSSQTALYAFDTTGTVRIGVAQFSHGGGGVALHGENSKGATVLYHKGEGSLTFYDTTGSALQRIPEE